MLLTSLFYCAIMIIEIEKGVIKMKTTEIRKRLGVTQREFAEMFEIPIGTVKNWDARDCAPEYLANIFNRMFQIESERKEREEYLMERNKKLQESNERYLIYLEDKSMWCGMLSGAVACMDPDNDTLKDYLDSLKA